jgi:RHS repeat-associated protein
VRVRAIRGNHNTAFTASLDSVSVKVDYSAASVTAITVNAVGATTDRGTDTFTYDQASRLKTATVSGITETYTYDGDGVRFSRQVGAGPVTRYVSDVNAGLPVTLDDGTRKSVFGLGLAYAVSASGIELYHTDRLGSVRAVSDVAGVVSATWRTDEFGIPTASTGASSQPFTYTGEPRDATGLSYLRARYYDPTLGRFMSRDPFAGFGTGPLSLNRYSYVGNNPTRYRDPSGRVCVEALVLVAGGPAGALAGGGITVGCFIVVAIAAGAAAWVTGSAIGEATSPLVEEFRADPTRPRWTPLYAQNQPILPRQPSGDHDDPDLFSTLKGLAKWVGITVVISRIALALAGRDHLGEPQVEPEEPAELGDGRSLSMVMQPGR